MASLFLYTSSTKTEVKFKRKKHEEVVIIRSIRNG